MWEAQIMPLTNDSGCASDLMQHVMDARVLVALGK